MIHSLPSTVETSHKRLGRGHGSGRGKTSGRGTKGQKARGSIPPHFEGGQLSVMKRLPFLRGKTRNKSMNIKPVTVSTDRLSHLPAGSKITVEFLKKQDIVAERTRDVKVLAGKELSVALSVAVPCSEGAKRIIEKAGGSVA